MRNGQNKRMRGRNRKGGHHQNPLSRMYESNGQDVKIRGTASHIAEKYLQLARDAQSSGDPIAAENYYQHAEHYFRLIAAAQEQLRQTQPYYQPQQGDARGNASDDDYDDGEGDQPSMGGEPFAPASRNRSIRASSSTSRSNISRNNNSPSLSLSSTTSRVRSIISRPITTPTSSACRRSSPVASRSLPQQHNQGGQWRPKWTEWLRRFARPLPAAPASPPAPRQRPTRPRSRSFDVRRRRPAARPERRISAQIKATNNGKRGLKARACAYRPRGALASRAKSQIGTTITAPSRK